jgi:putative DNA primase/helicase
MANVVKVTGQFLDAALEYLDRGWRPVPLRPGTKKACVPWAEYQHRSPTVQEIHEWARRWPDANTAILTGAASGIVAVDIDSEEAQAEIDALIGDVVTPTSLTAKGRHLLFQAPPSPLGNRVRIDGSNLDFRGDGGYIAAPPSVHPSGIRYRWDTESGRGPDCPIAPLPHELLDLLRSSSVEPRLNNTSLPAVILEGARNQTLFDYACVLYDLGDSSVSVLAKLTEANLRCTPPLPTAEIATIAASAERYRKTRRGRPEAPRTTGEHLTDLGNARRLVKLHGHELRYVVECRTWLAWNGRFWERDTSGEVMRRAKTTVQSMYGEAEATEDSAERQALARWAQSSESKRHLEAMVSLAQTEAEVAISASALDADPLLLNVENGTIDLRTGTLKPHDPADLITRLIPVPFDPDAQAPVWHAFLARVMGGDEELVRYLQRLVGYTLTGLTDEQILAFLHGYGANGKTTFLNSILSLLGPYGKQGDPQLLLARNGDGHPTGMADLAGCRLVVCSEVDEGRPLAEATVKQLTGGDRIKARFMHQDFFEYLPTHTIWLAANHKPIVKGTDYAIWRRIRLVPFTVTIPEAERDRELPRKLLGELPGILAWAVQGCLEWQRTGLAEPEPVRNATREYRSEMDLLEQFLDECVVHDKAAAVSAGDLYEAYRQWCDRGGLNPQSNQSFGRKLVERGFDRHRSTGGRRSWRGVRLRSQK